MVSSAFGYEYHSPVLSPVGSITLIGFMPAATWLRDGRCTNRGKLALLV